jgi:hypothetical protein
MSQTVPGLLLSRLGGAEVLMRAACDFILSAAPTAATWDDPT